MNHQVVGTGSGSLPPAELAELRKMLEEQRVFRRDQLTGPASGRGGGEPETASRREVRDALCTTARMVLADVEAALRRMDDGGYGRCLRCGHAIALPRLRIVPQARYCSPCHRLGEAGR